MFKGTSFFSYWTIKVCLFLACVVLSLVLEQLAGIYKHIVWLGYEGRSFWDIKLLHWLCMGSYWLYLGIIFASFALYLFIHCITDALKPIRNNTKNVSCLTAYFLYIGFLSLLPIMIYAKSPRQLLLPLWSLLSPRWADKSLSSHRRISIEKDHCIVIFWLHGSIQWWFKEGKANSSSVIIENSMLSIGSYKYYLL